MTATLVKGGPQTASPRRASAGAGKARSRRTRRRGRIIALLFVFPALLLLGALVVYPVLFSVGRSFFDASGTRFVGGENYAEMFRDPATLKAIRNTTIWVVVAPALLTGLGLILAVLVEKVRWATAFKLLLFMPMAVSFLAAGIIFRLAYDEDPDKGVLNAAAVSVHDAFQGTSTYPTARATRRAGAGEGGGRLVPHERERVPGGGGDAGAGRRAARRSARRHRAGVRGSGAEGEPR